MDLAVHPRYRLHLYFHSLTIIVLGAVLAGWGVYRTIPAGLGAGSPVVQAPPGSIEQLLFWRVVLLYLVIALFIILATIALHLFYSNRIAGPAYRIGLEAAKIGSGLLSPDIRLREKDNLMDMAESLNDLAAKYRTRITGMDNALLELDRLAQAADEMVRAGAAEAEIRPAMAKIAETVKKIEHTLAEIRI